MIEIYLIVNLVNQKTYVGQTKNLEFRWKEHKKLLKKNDHHNSHLQNAWNLYGAECFEFIKLIDTANRDESDKLEDFLIEWYKEINLCYNIQSGNKTYLLSEEEKEKLVNYWRNQRQKYNSVVQLIPHHCIKCNLYIESKTRKYCDKCLSKHRSDTQRNRTVSKETKEKLSKANLGKKHSEESKMKNKVASTYYYQKNTEKFKEMRAKCIESRSVSFTIISPEGEVFEGKNICKFCRENGLKTTNFYRLLSGKLSDYKGWKRN